MIYWIIWMIGMKNRKSKINYLRKFIHHQALKLHKLLHRNLKIIRHLHRKVQNHSKFKLINRKRQIQKVLQNLAHRIKLLIRIIVQHKIREIYSILCNQREIKSKKKKLKLRIRSRVFKIVQVPNK